MVLRLLRRVAAFCGGGGEEGRYGFVGAECDVCMGSLYDVARLGEESGTADFLKDIDRGTGRCVLLRRDCIRASTLIIFFSWLLPDHSLVPLTLLHALRIRASPFSILRPICYRWSSRWLCVIRRLLHVSQRRQRTDARRLSRLASAILDRRRSHGHHRRHRLLLASS